ncbi:hypothetical protein EV714DRAFT_206529 [Schizophyllum commune]
MSVDMLTKGAIMRLATCDDDDDLFNSGVVLQALSVKSINEGKEGKQGEKPAPKPGQAERLRIILSDGEWFMQAMLATQLNDVGIEKNSIVRISRASRNIVQNRRLVIVLGLEIVQHFDEKLRRDPNDEKQPWSLPSEYLKVKPDGENGQSPAPQSKPAAAPSTSAVPRTSTPQLPAQPHRDSKNTAPNGRSIYPIEGLSPYQNNWTIKARVTQKSDIRRWSNQRGEGRLFNVTLMDDTGEIRATGFNQAVDELYDKFEEGKVYFVSKARVNLAKKKFSNVNNDYELSLERSTEVEPCLEAADVPTIKYNFVKLDALQEVPKDSNCDVIGVVKEVGELSEITTKTTNRTMKKRELTLVDDTGFSVRVTLWGNTAEKYEEEGHPVIAFKGVKVGDFGGRSLSMLMSSMMFVNPDTTEAFHLRGWFDDDGKTLQFSSHTSGGGGPGTGRGFDRDDQRTLMEIKNANLGMGDQPDYFSSRATIMHIKDNNFAYPACRSPDCNKKVVENGPGEWRCEKCNVSHSSPDYRFMLQLAVADLHGQAWFQGFNDAGQIIFNRSANEIMQMKAGDDDGVLRAFAQANYQAFNFNCRAKADTWNDETRVRYGITKVEPVDFVKEAQYMRDKLQSEWGAEI